MLKSLSPGNVWIIVMPMVSMVMKMRIRNIVAQLAIPDRLCLGAKANTCLVQSNRIK